MLETILGRRGITKEEFLQTRILLAKATDKFNDNKCCYCWEPYNGSSHPGIRFRPCDHIVGRPCLFTIINSPGGHTCPICRSVLFQPPPAAVEDEDTTDFKNWLPWVLIGSGLFAFATLAWRGLTDKGCFIERIGFGKC